MRKKLLILILLLISVKAFSQNNNSYDLNWKISKNEFLVYKTNMDELEGAKVDSIDNLSSFPDTLGSISDSLGHKERVNELIESIKKKSKNYYFLTILTKKRERVKVAMLQKSVSSENNMSKENSNDNDAYTKGVQFRGELNSKGGIYSFYLQRKQKNLLALFFQLPEQPVKIGDSWGIDLQFVATDQTFDCDSATSVNVVTLIDVKVSETDTIATIRYDVHEYVKGDYINIWENKTIESEIVMDYDANCEFNITTGRWKSFNAIMSFKSTGRQNITQKFKYSLVEAEINEKDKDLIRN